MMSVRWWRKLFFATSLFLSTVVVVFIYNQICEVRTRRNSGEAVPEFSSLGYATDEQNVASRTASAITAPATSSAQQPSPNTSQKVENMEEPPCSSGSLGKSGGFALAITLHDQQTWALGNLLSLQNWAASLGLTVLQPFLLSTALGVPTQRKQLLSKTTLPLGALYNMEYWNEDAKIKGYSPTVPWDCFLSRAPKKLVLVHTDVVIATCNTKKLRSRAHFLTESLGFSVVREFCLAKVAYPARTLSVDKFYSKILGKLTAGDVTVVFSEWSQHTVGSLLDLDTAHTPMALSSTLPLKPSKSVTADADTYISRFFNNEKFVAVLFRSEWLKMYSKLSVFNETLRGCITNSLGYIQRSEEATGSESVFLGLDVGKYGSATITSERGELTQEAFENMLLPSTHFESFSEWEKSFELVSSCSVPGYVALLQRTIAGRASCLLLLGSGSFLKQALKQYRSSLSSSSSRRCFLQTDGNCNAFRIVGF